MGDGTETIQRESGSVGTKGGGGEAGNRGTNEKPYSISTKNLYAALLKAQAEFPTIPKDASNSYFKSKDGKPSRYATLDSIRKTIQPTLVKYGLVLIQPTVLFGDDWVLETKLIHATSGEWITTGMPINLNQAPQQTGSHMTYLRRYSICSLLNIVADEDDDGNAAQAAQPARPQNYQKNNPQADATRSVSEKMVKRWYAVYRGNITQDNPHAWTIDQVKEIIEKSKSLKLDQLNKTLYDSFEDGFKKIDYKQAVIRLGAAPEEIPSADEYSQFDPYGDS